MKTTIFDAAAYLFDQESRDEYMRLAVESGDPDEVAEAVQTIARAIRLANARKG